MDGSVTDMFFSNLEKNKDRYTNPFYDIASQYLPVNIDQQLQWAEFFLTKFGFYRSAIGLIANYFITQLSIECEDEDTKQKLEDIFEEKQWQVKLYEVGLNIVAYGQNFGSITQGFDRFITCPKCDRRYHLAKVKNFKYEKGKYKSQCVRCGFKGVFPSTDKPTVNAKEISIVNWHPREIHLMHDEVTGKAEYYWEIPESYKQKITAKNDRFYCKVVPEVIYRAINENKMVEFNTTNFLHLKIPNPTHLKTNGKSIPLCIYLFNEFFMYKVLERFNEVICYEDINPFRIFSMDNGSGMSNPLVSNSSGAMWAASIKDMIERHRRDPGNYQITPFPVNYQVAGGLAKQFAPVEMLSMAQQNILNALNIPQELYTMNLQFQTSGAAALRLFENSWSFLTTNYNKQLQHWANVICKIYGLPRAKVSLLPSTFADDIERKSVLANLMASNSISRSEFLKMFNISFEDQVRKKIEEERITQELYTEEQERQQMIQVNKRSLFGAGGGAQQSPDGLPPPANNLNELSQQADELSQQLQPMSGPERRSALQQIKGSSEELWHLVKSKLGQLDSQARSQGLAQSKEQG